MRSWLIALRDKAGMSQEALARRVGITQPSLSNIENGKTSPSVLTAMRIADVLGFPWTDFFKDSKP